MSVPFRWDLARREQLGRLVDGPCAPSYPEILEDIRACSARVLSLSRDSDLLFLGRSPESIFDYLSGALRDTSWASRLDLVNLSLRGQDLKEIRREYPDRLRLFYEHLTALALDPTSLLARARPVAFVDLVNSGATYAHLTEVLMAWARETGDSTKAMVKRIRFVGITWRTKTSPNTERWHQDAAWLADFPGDAVKNVSIPGVLWDYLGNRQQKVALSNPPWRWGDWETKQPPHYEKNIEALRLAVRMYDAGADQKERMQLAREISATAEFRQAWLRVLTSELKGRKADR